ncbi:Cfr10I/Bse634I family restriction endonuclease [Phormidesmis sp. 146-12]
MNNYSDWFVDRKNSKGEVVGQIKKLKIYEALSSEIVKRIEGDLPANEILNWIKEQTRQAHRERYSLSLEVGALNNVVGDWNEYMVTTAFSEIAIDINASKRESIVVIFPLPNSQISPVGSSQVSSKFLNLFRKSEFAIGGALHGIDEYKDRIFFSSPDYIIAVLHRDCSQEVQTLLENQARQPSNAEAYQYLRETLKVSELKAAISVKTEYRPDRRYQPLFEADLVKQLGCVARQTWKYYMVASKVTSSDTSLFERITTPHAHNNDYKLVDGAFLFLRKADLIPLVEEALN